MSDEKKAISKTIGDGEEINCDEVVPFSVKMRGSTNWYCIGPMSGEARDTYLSELKKTAKTTTKVDGTMNVEISDFRGMSTLMLKHCVFDYDNTAKASVWKLVDPGIIKTWPTKVLDRLVNTANEINALGADADATVKND